MSEIGDRYKAVTSGLTHEITRVYGNLCEFVCVDVGTTTNWIVGEQSESPTSDYWTPPQWEYLGNYGKSRNFNNLYEILKG